MKQLDKHLGLATLAWGSLVGVAAAQGWDDNFDSYAAGSPVDPGGTSSIGNGWESWSSGIGSSTVAGLPPAPTALSAPNSLSNNPGADTVNIFEPPVPTSGKWLFCGDVFHEDAFRGRSYWILLNTYSFGGPYDWSVQTWFDGDTGRVDCDCAGMNDPAGPALLIRDAWVPFRAEIDLDQDVVDVFYADASLTAGQGYAWSAGIFGTSTGLLEVQALDLYPDVVGAPHTTETYYDDLWLFPDAPPLCCPFDPACVPLPNSTGLVATTDLQFSGVFGDPVLATVQNGPPGQFGYFLTGPNSGLYIVPPGSSGVICIGGPQYRYASVPLGQVFQFDAAGASQAVTGGGPVVLPTDGSYTPVPVLMPGETRVFQAWYRDVAPLGSNFSESRTLVYDPGPGC